MIVVLATCYIVLSRTGFNSPVPEGFTKARLQGALISQDIVILSKQTADTLSDINQMDRDQEYAKAIALTETATQKSKDIREKAASLSEELKVMAQSLTSIKSESARELALASIQSRMDLIEHLISYAQKIEELMNVLQMRFEGQPGYGGKVAQLLSAINGEVGSINEMNEKAAQQMDRFDSATR